MAEWLRRWTANPMCSARVGSNPILVAQFFFLSPLYFFFYLYFLPLIKYFHFLKTHSPLKVQISLSPRVIYRLTGMNKTPEIFDRILKIHQVKT